MVSVSERQTALLVLDLQCERDGCRSGDGCDGSVATWIPGQQSGRKCSCSPKGRKRKRGSWFLLDARLPRDFIFRCIVADVVDVVEGSFCDSASLRLDLFPLESDRVLSLVVGRVELDLLTRSQVFLQDLLVLLVLKI